MDPTQRPPTEITQAVAPSLCPFCKSTAISTSSKRIDESTYWRCGQCGEVWNVGRQTNYNRNRRPW